ncbi:MAG: glycoside hydrolase family 3 C-terminal domain-containing protein [Bacteroides sp.]|nr:glycoside hydrolase family 3 C-terminal domain-containing protein [Bacteroides sp.]
MKKSDIKALVAQMTLEEKVSLLTGANAWSTVAVPRLGIPSINLSDGPHGLRRCDGLGWGKSVPATCFPPAVLLACSFDEELAKKQGAAIGEEAQAQDVQIVLGPANNIKRSPLGGRCFEYCSEDPVLSGHIAAGIIEGIQSKKVGTALKHFACNSQETERFVIDELIDERALREIYLASFEYPIKKAKPASVMCAYNKINGEYCSQNRRLLNDILREEWGFKGFVMSDWGAVDNRAQGVYAGLELEMPGTGEENKRELMNAVNGERVSLPSTDPKFKNKLTVFQINKAVTRLLEVVFALHEKKTEKPCDYPKHHKTAVEIARECMVLLKNNGALPIKGGKTAVIGEMAVNPRYQGGGSSYVNAINVAKPLDAMAKYGEVEYSQGYSLENDRDYDKISDAAKLAGSCDRAVIICGLPLSYESEGYDRSHINLPDSQLKLIDEVVRRQPNTVVVLCNGSPVAMPFVGKVSGILEAYLGGEGAGEAIADILYGKVNPSGKLAESFPQYLEHNPSYGSFPGENGRVRYSEGIFVGYRWYEKHNIPALFPFGFGLSYTTFRYDGIELSESKIDENDEITVTVSVSNTGALDGKEAIQLYVREESPRVSRPEKELKAFKKVFIKAGESVRVSFTLDRRCFAYWDDEIHDWRVDSGKFTVLAGGSSDNCPLTANIEIKAREYFKELSVHTVFSELKGHPDGEKFIGEILSATGGELKQQLDNMPGDWSLRTLVSMCESKLTLTGLVDIIEKINSKSSDPE